MTWLDDVRAQQQQSHQAFVRALCRVQQPEPEDAQAVTLDGGAQPLAGHDPLMAAMLDTTTQFEPAPDDD